MFVCVCMSIRYMYMWVVLHTSMQGGQRRILGALTCNSMSYWKQKLLLELYLGWQPANPGNLLCSTPTVLGLQVHLAMPGFCCCVDSVIWIELIISSPWQLPFELLIWCFKWPFMSINTHNINFSWVWYYYKCSISLFVNVFIGLIFYPFAFHYGYVMASHVYMCR